MLAKAAEWAVAQQRPGFETDTNAAAATAVVDMRRLYYVLHERERTIRVLVERAAVAADDNGGSGSSSDTSCCWRAADLHIRAISPTMPVMAVQDGAVQAIPVTPLVRINWLARTPFFVPRFGYSRRAKKDEVVLQFSQDASKGLVEFERTHDCGIWEEDRRAMLELCTEFRNMAETERLQTFAADVAKAVADGTRNMSSSYTRPNINAGLRSLALW
jgi:hypothetical protein